jgi:hypothetical protein
MTGVLQSGNVTPGHLATWTTDGIIQDGGPILASQKVLTSIRSASFNTTSDQPLILPPSIVAFQLTGILVTNASVSLSTAAGGFYTGAGRTGAVIVTGPQSYASLTNGNVLLLLTITTSALATRFSSNNLPLLLNANGQYALGFYFSLSTPQGVAATADIYALGIDLS